MRNRNYTINRNLESHIMAHLTALQAKYSKLLPIRIDFHYQKGTMPLEYSVDAYMDMLNLSDLALINNIVIGYAWVMEHSENGDIHFHAIFYLNGQKHQNYYPTYLKLDDMWSTLTDNRGYTYDVNRDQDKYYIQGLNKLNHNDQYATEALKYTLSYFAKEEQKEYLRDNLIDTFRTSEVSPPSGRGRPRKVR